VQRRAKMDTVEQGGWSIFHTGWSGLDMINPAGHVFLRGNGKVATVGWPNSPRIEELRETWFRAPDIGAQKVLAEQLQLQAFEDVPYIPLGQYFIPTAYQANLTGMLQGSPVFWNIRRS
jgi:peptide/nickel transport system substrate-binding protein